MPPRIVLGTRGSALARWQAERIGELLREAHHALVVETSIISSAGDIDPHTPIERLDQQGVFVQRLEQALSAGEIDAAVHSLKDMPASPPAGLVIGAIPRRHDARDALLSREGFDLASLPPGAVVATGSVRRRSMLLHARPDIRLVPVRGNVDTRVRLLVEGRFHAVVLALAGVERLGITSVRIVPLPPSLCLPAVGQGAIAVEVRKEDAAARRLVDPLNHPASVAACAAERAFLRELGGGCQAPATAYARLEDDRLMVEAAVGDPAGRVLLWEREAGPPEAAEVIGARLARRLGRAGADRILARARTS